MSLLCSLGYHRPHGVPRWNDGYYFARCGRCGSDLIRTAYGSWEVPRGYRIVWQAQPPAERPEIKLEPAAAAPEQAQAPAQAQATAPPPIEAEAGSSDQAIQSQAAGEDSRPKGRKGKRSAGEAAGDAQPVEIESPPPRRPSNFPDFMDEDFGRSPARPRSPTHLPPPETSGGDGTAAALAALPRLLDNLRRPRPDPVEEDEPAEHPLSRGSMFFIFGSAAIAALIVAAVIVALYRGPVDRPAQSGPVAADGSPFALGQPAEEIGAFAYVTASLLSCRSAPSQQATRLRSLARGTRVSVLVFDGDWVSLASDGRQCWVLARYLSSTEPY